MALWKICGRAGSGKTTWLCRRIGQAMQHGQPLYLIHILKPHDMDPVTIPEDCVFVMGDNRANSMDSVSIGPIQKKYIVGHALFIVWPFSQIGGL